jgi:hypothetical protein
MAEGKSSRSAKPALGIVGAALAIASIWWFALRPRRKAGRASQGGGDAE